jgi:hypothetical protein
VQVAHGGHERNPVLSAQLVAQFLDGTNNFHCAFQRVKAPGISFPR